MLISLLLGCWEPDWIRGRLQHNCTTDTLWLFNIAMEHDPFADL